MSFALWESLRKCVHIQLSHSHWLSKVNLCWLCTQLFFATTAYTCTNDFIERDEVEMHVLLEVPNLLCCYTVVHNRKKYILSSKSTLVVSLIKQLELKVTFRFFTGRGRRRERQKEKMLKVVTSTSKIKDGGDVVPVWHDHCSVAGYPSSILLGLAIPRRYPFVRLTWRNVP